VPGAGGIVGAVVPRAAAARRHHGAHLENQTGDIGQCFWGVTPMSDDLYPSGPWIGFYLYKFLGSPRRYRMDLHLTFSQGRMAGEGNDNIGPFIINGKYD